LAGLKSGRTWVVGTGIDLEWLEDEEEEEGKEEGKEERCRCLCPCRRSSSYPTHGGGGGHHAAFSCACVRVCVGEGRGVSEGVVI
jgi:hypothetical protein